MSICTTKLKTTEWHPLPFCNDPNCSKQHVQEDGSELIYHNQLSVRTGDLGMGEGAQQTITVLHFSGKKSVRTTFFLPIQFLERCQIKMTTRMRVVPSALQEHLLTPLIAMIGEYLNPTLEDEVNGAALEFFNGIADKNNTETGNMALKSEWGTFLPVAGCTSFLIHPVPATHFDKRIEILFHNRGTHILAKLLPPIKPQTHCTIL